MFVRPVRHFAGCAFVGARRPDAGPRPLFVWNCAINNNNNNLRFQCAGFLRTVRYRL